MATQPDRCAGSRSRVLIISNAKSSGTKVGADGAWKLAESMSREHDVILAVPEISEISNPRFAVVYYNRRNIGLLARDSDVVILGRAVLKKNPSLAGTGSLAAASPEALSAGSLSGRALGQSPETIGAGELLVLRPVPRTTPKAGPRQYLSRLRNRLRRARQWKPFY